MQYSNTTFSADPDDPLLPPAREIAAFFLRTLPGAGLALLLIASLPAASATRMHAWPWAGFAAAFWSLVLGVALGRLILQRPGARLGAPLDAAFAGLALAGFLAALLSPLRPALLPHLLPYLGALALPYALLPLVRSPRLPTLAGFLLWPLLLVSGVRWLASLPSWSGPYPRNAEPFGHPNITGSVFVLAAFCFCLLAARSHRLPIRLLQASGALASVALSLSTQGRGATLALAAGLLVALGLFALRRGRPLALLSIGGLALATVVFSNDRLREAALAGRWSAADSESNAQRVAMIRGGLLLAAERPLLGWGPGSVPHAFPRVRAGLPGQPDNYLQLHNTPAQIAATLGLAGLASAGLLAAALLLRLRRAPSPLLAGAVATTFTLLLFDHSFAVPAFAALAALPVALLAPAPPFDPAPPRRSLAVTLAFSTLAAGLLLLAFPVSRDLAARSAWSQALDQFARDNASAYREHLRRAVDLAPASPCLSDQLAAHLAIGHPFPGLPGPDPHAAASVLQASLKLNPDLESARYNLGWLLLDSDPAAARAHLAAAARLAPARAGVHLGHALACLRLADTPSAIRSLAAEILLSPALAWSPFWREPSLAPLREPAMHHASAFLESRSLAPTLVARLRTPGAPLADASTYRRIRTGQGVLFGQPDGPPPVDVPLLLRPAPPPALKADLPPAGFLSPANLLECAGL